MSYHFKNARKMPPEHMPRYDPQARGIPTHAHVSTPLTTRKIQALFVVFNAANPLSAAAIHFPEVGSLIGVDLYVHILSILKKILFYCSLETTPLSPTRCFSTAVIIPTCSATQRQCSFNSSVCVEDSRFCDGHSDCPDGSDEGVGCLLDGCEQNNGGCSQVCNDIPEGLYMLNFCFNLQSKGADKFIVSPLGWFILCSNVEYDQGQCPKYTFSAILRVRPKGLGGQGTMIIYL